MKKIFISFISILLLIFICRFTILFLSFRDAISYQINTPYDFPFNPSPSLDIQSRIEYYSIDDETIDKMSTMALLETYLRYPLTHLNLINANFNSDVFEDLKLNHHFGLSELLERSDFYKVLYEKYSSYKIISASDMTTLSDLELSRYNNEHREMMYLEIMASQVDIKNNKYGKKIFKEISKKASLKKENPDFYNGYPTNMYDWSIKQDYQLEKEE